MKIGLICPSNKLYMPYLSNYIKILEETNVEFIVINWDRLNIEHDHEYVYKDRKKGLRRNIFDYTIYKKFLIKLIEKEKFDKLIIFSLQLTFSLRNILLKRYNNNFIIDIRDHNKIADFYKFEKIFSQSSGIVVSSNQYKEWLPQYGTYFVNHNTLHSAIDFKKTGKVLNKQKKNIKKEKYNISYIGAIRDCDINKKLIESLKNNKVIDLVYNGEGICKKTLEEFVEIGKIANVEFTGLYKKNEECELYKSADMINIIRDSESINDQTALPNRLYNALLYEKPFLALRGTYLSGIVEQYSLGLVLENFDNIDVKIVEYLDNFSREEFVKNSIAFFEKVDEDNNIFKLKITQFVSE